MAVDAHWGWLQSRPPSLFLYGTYPITKAHLVAGMSVYRKRNVETSSVRYVAGKKISSYSARNTSVPLNARHRKF